MGGGHCASGASLLTFTMKYLYTDNATQEYKGKGREYYKFKAIQTVFGWVGVLECSEALAKELIEVNPRNIREIDEKFYSEVIKKKNANQNHKTIQVSMDPTKPVHAEYKEKAEDAEFVEVEAIEVRDIEEKPKPKSRAKKAKK
jgi:hypothetical protein